MRKISKKIEEDLGSSNSVTNEETGDRDAANGDENEDKRYESDEADEPEPKEPPKKRATKTKAAKKSVPAKVADESEEEEYEVEKVIDSKMIKGKLHYLIRWKGYGADNDTWEPENTLSCPELINKFQTETKEKSPSKNKKRKSGSKKELKPKKAKKEEWDSENADENAEYEVDRILEVHHKKNGKREFLIHWKGWSTKYDSWEPEDNLNCSDLIKKFMDKLTTAKSSGSRSLRVAPESTKRFTLQDAAKGRRLSKRRGQKQRIRYDDAE